uniref:myosin heavy chain IB-like n=1 Tax=Panthera onca TaxID=9690 RepID=UPI0029549663|nr:myosin heavy chain IB-like [Panthera onca]
MSERLNQDRSDQHHPREPSGIPIFPRREAPAAQIFTCEHLARSSDLARVAAQLRPARPSATLWTPGGRGLAGGGARGATVVVLGISGENRAGRWPAAPEWGPGVGPRRGPGLWARGSGGQLGAPASAPPPPPALQDPARGRRGHSGGGGGGGGGGGQSASGRGGGRAEDPMCLVSPARMQRKRPVVL